MSAIECAFEGRVGQPPTLRTSQAGKPWCSLSVAVGADDAVQWLTVSVFGSSAESVAALAKGTRVYVEGRLKLDTWTDREGQSRTGLKVAATLVQPLGQIGRRKPAKGKGGREGDPSAEVVSKPMARSGAAGDAFGDGGGAFDAEIPF